MTENPFENLISVFHMSGKCAILFLEFMPNEPKFMPKVSEYYA